MHNAATLFDDDTLSVATALSCNVGGVALLRMPGAQFKNLFENIKRNRPTGVCKENPLGIARIKVRLDYKYSKTVIIYL